MGSIVAPDAFLPIPENGGKSTCIHCRPYSLDMRFFAFEIRRQGDKKPGRQAGSKSLEPQGEADAGGGGAEGELG